MTFPPQRTVRGFALAELLICTVIFGLLTGLCFYAAASGFRLFTHGTGRQALQRDTRAVFAWLQRDLGLSNLVRCQTSEHQVGGYRKDTLAVVGMSSWQEPIVTDPLELPAWDRLIVYQVTPLGVLDRVSFEAGALGLAVPLQATGVVSGLARVEAASVAPRDRRRLSDSVRTFAVTLDRSRNTAVLDLVLQGATIDGGTGRARNEVLQIQTTITPRNTWPRL